MSDAQSAGAGYAYKMPRELTRPDANRHAEMSWVIHPEPLAAEQRLITGVLPNQRHWEVVAVEPTSGEGLRVGGPGGPIGWKGPSPADAIVSGQLVLRPLEPSFENPEDAAVADFPPQYARVERVDYSKDGSRATVKLLTNEEPCLYPYFVYCERDESGRWTETHSSN